MEEESGSPAEGSGEAGERDGAGTTDAPIEEPAYLATTGSMIHAIEGAIRNEPYTETPGPTEDTGTFGGDATFTSAARGPIELGVTTRRRPRRRF